MSETDSIEKDVPISSGSLESQLRDYFVITGATEQDTQPLESSFFDAVRKVEAAGHSQQLGMKLSFLELSTSHPELLDTPLAQHVVTAQLDEQKDTLQFDEALPSRGDIGPVKTNTMIENIFFEFDKRKRSPGAYFTRAMNLVQERRQEGIDKIGPENLATIAHYYHRLATDYENTGVRELEPDIVKDWVQKLKETTNREHLNKIGIGNIMKSMGLLIDYVDDDFYELMYQECARNVLTFSEQTAQLFYRGIASIPPDKLHHGYLAMFQVAQHMQPIYDRNREFADSLRALSSFEPRMVPDHTYHEVYSKGVALARSGSLSIDDLIYSGGKALTTAEQTFGQRRGLSANLVSYTSSCLSRAEADYKKQALIASHIRDIPEKDAKFDQLREQKNRIKSLTTRLKNLDTLL